VSSTRRYLGITHSLLTHYSVTNRLLALSLAQPSCFFICVSRRYWVVHTDSVAEFDSQERKLQTGVILPEQRQQGGSSRLEEGFFGLNYFELV
jgi:hypothetical protein